MSVQPDSVERCPPAPELLDRFAAIVGIRYALRDDDAVSPHLREERGLLRGRSPLVLRPGSVDEVSQILRLATETRTAIVPQGGNTGLVGGQIPDESGSQIVLSLSRLDRIREIDAANATITAEAGVVLKTLQTAAADAGRLFPLALGAQGSCQIGGNLSSNAGGTAVLAYGNARDLCLGVEVVLPTGEILDDMRKLRKDNTGYDLKNLFVGAEGTLGVITAAVLKLFPQPRGREVAWIGTDTPAAALALFELAADRCGSALTGFELVSAMAFDFSLRHMPAARAPLESRWPWYILMEVSSGRSAEDARSQIENVLEAGIENGHAGDAVLAGSLSQAAAFWHVREFASEAQKYEGASIKHDIAMPVLAIPRFIDEAAVAVAAVSPAARVACFGHMGDGNLHYNVSQPPGEPPDRFLGLYPAMNEAVLAVVRALDGSISAEHGIGSMKRAELRRSSPPVALDLMRRIKAAFDPAAIMNPGKVL